MVWANSESPKKPLPILGETGFRTPSFETEDDIIRGGNGFFTIENGRLRLSDREYCKTAKNGSLSLDQMFDAIFSRAMAGGRNSKSLKLFSQLFLGSFHAGFFGSHRGNPKVLNHSFQ